MPMICLLIQNQELSTMHASKAFMDFINKKTVRKPEVRNRVSVCWSHAVLVVSVDDAVMVLVTW